MIVASLSIGTADLRIKARDDGFLVDHYGRVRIFHGFNDVQLSKGTGYKPGGPDYLPKAMGHESIVSALEESGQEYWWSRHRSSLWRRRIMAWRRSLAHRVGYL